MIMKSTKEKGVYSKETKNGYLVKVDFNLHKVYVSHPDFKPIQYNLNFDTPLSQVGEIISGLEKLVS